MKRYVWTLLAFTSVVSFLLGLVASGPGNTPVPDLPHRPVSLAGSASAPGTQPVAVTEPIVSGAPVDFATVVSRLNVTVVNVDTISRDTEEGSRFVYPRRGSDELREGSGSGFVIDPSGLILTNYHVIDDATRVTVTLRDGRSFRAAVFGVDPAIDVALLQVNVKEKLPVAPLG